MLLIHFAINNRNHSKSHFDEDTSPKGLSVLNLSIFCLPTSLYKVSSYNSYQVFLQLLCNDLMDTYSSEMTE